MNAEEFLKSPVRSVRGGVSGEMKLGEFLLGVRLGWWVYPLVHGKQVQKVWLGKKMVSLRLRCEDNPHIRKWGAARDLVAREKWVMAVYVCCEGLVVVCRSVDREAGISRLRELGYRAVPRTGDCHAAYDAGCYVAAWIEGLSGAGEEV